MKTPDEIKPYVQFIPDAKPFFIHSDNVKTAIEQADKNAAGKPYELYRLRDVFKGLSEGCDINPKDQWLVHKGNGGLPKITGVAAKSTMHEPLERMINKIKTRITRLQIAVDTLEGMRHEQN